MSSGCESVTCSNTVAASRNSCDSTCKINNILIVLMCCPATRHACVSVCRCADLDCDGVITPSEMWHFYEEQMKRLEGLNQEPVLFEDVLCQLHDMLQVRPAHSRPQLGSLQQPAAKLVRGQACRAPCSAVSCPPAVMRVLQRCEVSVLRLLVPHGKMV